MQGKENREEKYKEIYDQTQSSYLVRFFILIICSLVLL